MKKQIKEDKILPGTMCYKKDCNCKAVKAINKSDHRRVYYMNVCEKHFAEYRQKHKKHNLVYDKNKKSKAQINSKNYFVNNRSKIAALPLLKRKETLALIDKYYADDHLLEARFAIMIQDVLTLQGGSPVHEYPYFTSETLSLCPKFADVVDRKLKIAIECKAAFWNCGQQLELLNQIADYKMGIRGYTVYGVSPDAVQKGSTSLHKFLAFVCKRRKKVLGK